MKMSKLSFIGFIAGSVLVAGLSYVFYTPKTESRYNVLFISIDTLAARHMSMFGYSKETTPFLNKFAKDGIVFKNFYANSNITLPSHMSMLTGTLPHRHGLIDVKKKKVLPEKFKTLMEQLKVQGYSTYWFANRFSEWLAPDIGFTRGVDQHVQGSRNKLNLKEVYDVLGRSHSPFFAFLHVSLVHDPYLQVPEVSKQCAELSPFGPSESKGSYQTNWQQDNEEEFDKFKKEYWRRFDLNNQEDVRKLIAAYNCGILYVDEYMATITDWLKSKGLINKTILVFTSDHGEAFGQHGRFRHLTLHNEILHIPLVIWAPDLKPRVVESLGSHIDIVPTILGILGIEKPAFVDGENLLNLSGNKPREILSIWKNHKSIMDHSWKLILSSYGAEEFYNLRDDPQEQKNLVNTLNSQTRPIYSRLKHKLLKVQYVEPNKLTGNR